MWKRLNIVGLDMTRADAFVLCCAVLLLGLFMLAPQRGVTRVPDELAALEPDAKKAAFFEFLRPVVADVNERVRRDKARLDTISAKIVAQQRLSWGDRRALRRLARKYGVDLDESDLIEDVMPTLARRIDTVPAALALVQAAKESGWGTSRFAVEGNNLYGQRCYEPDCGLAPAARPNARFHVERFDSVEESVESYILNLNTHERYREFRELRQELREQGEPLTGIELADALEAYSERGDSYVSEIKSLIRQNDLAQQIQHE